eukprot:1195832-Prorocentrum_minimum.AAC.4
MRPRALVLVVGREVARGGRHFLLHHPRGDPLARELLQLLLVPVLHLRAVGIHRLERGYDVRVGEAKVVRARDGGAGGGGHVLARGAASLDVRAQPDEHRLPARGGALAVERLIGPVPRHHAEGRLGVELPVGEDGAVVSGRPGEVHRGSVAGGGLVPIAEDVGLAAPAFGVYELPDAREDDAFAAFAEGLLLRWLAGCG